MYSKQYQEVNCVSFESVSFENINQVKEHDGAWSSIRYMEDIVKVPRILHLLQGQNFIQLNLQRS